MLLRKVLTHLAEMIFELIKIFYYIIKYVFNKIYVYLCSVLSSPHTSLPTFLRPVAPYILKYKPKISGFFIKVLDFFLFFFISVPWWICGEFVKPFTDKLDFYINKFIGKFFPLFFVEYVLCFFKNKIHIIRCCTYNAYAFVWKKIIDFIFFVVWANRYVILEKLDKYFYIFIKIFLFYLIFYSNMYILLYNSIFCRSLNMFFYWDLTSYYGLFSIFLCYINIDNLALLMYILVFKLGLLEVLNFSNNELLFYTGLYWTELYSMFKFNNQNYSFIGSALNTFTKNFSYVDYSFWEKFNDTPLFFFFACLFFTTVVASWLFFSYLGLYGIFKLNFLSLFFFWVSLLLTARSIFVDQKIFIIKVCNWAFIGLNTRIDCYFLIDTISFSFMLLTTTIAFFVFIYAFSYFRYEPLVDRFLLFLLSFVVSMIFLVISGNTIMLFLGWELIGLTSFFLINFWTTKTTTLKSAFKAFTFNKFSDFFMFMFLISTYSIFYTFDIKSLNIQVFKYEFLSIYIFNIPINCLEFVSIMLLGASFIKSAQIGGHAWLPDSMEAPVPASSLIHSATLVSAGIYLILRFNFILDHTQFSKLLIPLMGSITAAYGGICAIAQSDAKKTLAYSTISHCGFLMVLCATEMNEFTILYLYVHGFFKAGVFMCVGNVLRITRGYQDTRRMGGLFKYLPFEYFCGLIGLFNLAGLPFTFGFLIKHLLLISLGGYIYLYYFISFNCLLGAFSGLFYSYKLVTNIFMDFKKGNKILYSNNNKVTYNSGFYTNSSVAATFSILTLFIFSYLIIYFMFTCFLKSNSLFSDCMNTTILTNYYSFLYSYNGYLLNFSYINFVVILILLVLLCSRYYKTSYMGVLYNTICYFILTFCLFYFIYNKVI